MTPTRIILMSCGSYNPPTNMHLRMFEIARDNIHRMGRDIVVGGVISPTHDDYAHKELASAEHRCEMLKLATQNSDWIKVSTWETRQNGWTKTKLSLQHHQNTLNSVLLDTNDANRRANNDEETDWIPENVKNSADRTPIRIKLLCGGDLLESFGTPGLWADEDIDAIVGQHGLIVITREGSNPNKFIYDSDILSKYMYNIHIVTEWIPNDVSSTRIRRALKRGESVRYLIQDSVIDYIYNNGIYNAKTVVTTKFELISHEKYDNDYLCIQPKYESALLTPSPSDVAMTTPESPVEIITIDVSETVLKRNMQNYPSPGRANFSTTSAGGEDRERIYEKFISVITENGNKSLSSSKVAYPGQAKQIIANESGESQIFCEVGLSYIENNSQIESDGKAVKSVENIGESSLKEAALEKRKSIEDVALITKKNEETENTEGEISIMLSFDVLDLCRREKRPEIADFSSKDEKNPVEKVSQVREICHGGTGSDETSSGPQISGITEHRRISGLDDEKAIEGAAGTIVNRDEALESLETTKSTEKTLTPEESEGKVSFLLSFDVIDSCCRGSPEKLVDSSTKDDGKAKLNFQEENDDTGSNISSLSDAQREKNEGISATAIVERPRVINEAKNIDDEKSDDTLTDILLQDRVEEKMSAGSSRPEEKRKRSEAGDDGDSTSEELRGKRDVSMEIDGKYLKSVVNSRKSPKKVKHEVNEWKSTDNLDKSAVEITGKSGPDKSSLVPASSKTSKLEKKLKTAERRKGVLFQGSLDSINVNQPKSTFPSTSSNAHQRISKKSKSYEYIKSTEHPPTSIYQIPLDSPKNTEKNVGKSRVEGVSGAAQKEPNSTFGRSIEAHKSGKADEFCSVCCYPNEGTSTETFYGHRSPGSSPLDEVMQECDICSNFDLREDPEEEANEFKVAGAPGEPLCELCEICGDVAMDEDVVASSRPENDEFVDRRLLASRSLPLSLPKQKVQPERSTVRNFGNIDADDEIEVEEEEEEEEEEEAEIENLEIDSPSARGRSRSNEKLTARNIEKSVDEQSTADDMNSNDEFEIENCGLEPDNGNDENFRQRIELEDKLRRIHSREETSLHSAGNSKKIVRAGSLINRESVDRNKVKRRYSSVDNLQNSQKNSRVNIEKQHSLRSRGISRAHLVVSADNIRPSRVSRSRSLRKSADDVARGYHSSLDDTRESPIYENIARKKSSTRDQLPQKPRDAGTIKMVLTKHGIKITSDKETAL